MVPKKILFCADFSENSEPAREMAVDYAKAFRANLLIVHVIDSSSFSTYMDWVGEELSEILNRMQESANTRLESLAKECDPLVGKVETFCRIGLPAREIVSLADERSVDLIVVGTHGLTGVKHLVMGSIARSVLKTAHRPVLIVEALTGEGESSDRPYLFPVP
jgi:universal stress protein A